MKPEELLEVGDIIITPTSHENAIIIDYYYDVSRNRIVYIYISETGYYSKIYLNDNSEEYIEDNSSFDLISVMGEMRKQLRDKDKNRAAEA